MKNILLQQILAFLVGLALSYFFIKCREPTTSKFGMLICNESADMTWGLTSILTQGGNGGLSFTRIRIHPSLLDSWKPQIERMKYLNSINSQVGKIVDADETFLSQLSQIRQAGGEIVAAQQAFMSFMKSRTSVGDDFLVPHRFMVLLDPNAPQNHAFASYQSVGKQYNYKFTSEAPLYLDGPNGLNAFLDNLENRTFKVLEELGRSKDVVLQVKAEQDLLEEQQRLRMEQIQKQNTPQQNFMARFN